MKTFARVLAVVIWLVFLIALPTSCDDGPRTGGDSTENAPY